MLQWLDAQSPQTVGKMFTEKGYKPYKMDVTDESGKKTKRVIYWRAATGMDSRNGMRRYREYLKVPSVGDTSPGVTGEGRPRDQEHRDQGA